MIELILLLQADLDIQAAFNRYEEYQTERGEVFIRVEPAQDHARELSSRT